MENRGYIKLHRKIVDWEWYDDIPTKVLFIHLLLKVNHETKKWHGQEIKRGSCITSYASLIGETKLTKKQIERGLRNLMSTGEVEKVSNSQNTLLIVTNYELYQNQGETKVATKVTQKDKQRRNEGETKENKQECKECKEYIEEVNTSLSNFQKQEIMTLWNTLGLSRLTNIENARLKSVRARVNEYSFENFLQAIENIKESSFLKGQNSRNWMITFDWMIKPNNFPKVLEGNYTDKEKGTTTDSERPYATDYPLL